MKKIPQLLCMAGVLALTAGAANATMYDLSSSGSNAASVTGGIGGTALFKTFFDQPAGTGYIDPFLRTQLVDSPGSYCAGTVTGRCEQGYNTDGIEEFDSKEYGGHNWNHSVLLGDIPVVTINGQEYREFLLDINQAQGDQKSLLSFDELQFFITNNPAITGYDDAKNQFGPEATLVWEMDTYNGSRTSVTQNDWILLENCKSPGTCGSGDFDLQALIPNDVFGNDPNKYVVLFNRFGDNAGVTGANDGFEEWVHRTATPTNGVPEPGMLPLVLAGLIAAWAVRRRGVAADSGRLARGLVPA